MTQQQAIFEVHSVEDRRLAVSSTNKTLPLNKFIGNKSAIRRLSRAVFSAYGSENHQCSDYSIAFCGPPSTGKTYLTKLFAESLGIPFIVIEPQTVKKTHDVFLEIQKGCKEFFNANIAKETLSLYDYGNHKYDLPPMVVFIDEVHNLRPAVVQGLLKATEPNDRIMMTESGYTISTERVCWVIATTDRGELFDAFDTRFQKIPLRLYSKKEMSSIVKMNNPDWSDETCLLVANYNSQVPREAIAFAKDMRVEHQMNPRNWEDVANYVARDHGIDEYGMTYTRLDVLKALGQAPVSVAQLPFVIHVKEEELKKYIMPPLLSRTPDQKIPLVTVCNRGYSITPVGLIELDKRKIRNRGVDAIPEGVRNTFSEMEVCNV